LSLCRCAAVSRDLPSSPTRRSSDLVLTEIRRRVGRDFVVGVRISGDEFSPGGLGAGDMAAIARRLAGSGLIDFISVIGGGAHTRAGERPGRTIGRSALGRKSERRKE